MDERDDAPETTTQDDAGRSSGALDVARRASQGAAETLRNGLSAVRDVHDAARRHSTARDRLREMTDALEADEATLARREEVEADYEKIVREQGAVVSEASSEIARQRELVERAQAGREKVEGRLAQLRKDNEQELRPYKRIVETARGRSEEASRGVAEAKRAVRSAEGQVKEATERREQGIASANRSVDASQARLRKVQDALSRARDEHADASALRQLQNEVATELAHVEAARAEVTTVTKDAQSAVDAAQTHLWTQKKSLEEAQREADAAREEYEGRKRDYEGRLARARDAEADLEDEISKLQADEDEAKAAHDEAAERHDEAQALLEEAEDVHATPEETERLRGSIASQRAEIEAQQGVVDELAEGERSLRAHTRGERLALLGVAVAVVVVIAVIVVLVATSGA